MKWKSATTPRRTESNEVVSAVKSPKEGASTPRRSMRKKDNTESLEKATRSSSRRLALDEKPKSSPEGKSRSTASRSLRSTPRRILLTMKNTLTLDVLRAFNETLKRTITDKKL